MCQEGGRPPQSVKKEEESSSMAPQEEDTQNIDGLFIQTMSWKTIPNFCCTIKKYDR